MGAEVSTAIGQRPALGEDRVCLLLAQTQSACGRGKLPTWVQMANREVCLYDSEEDHSVTRFVLHLYHTVLQRARAYRPPSASRAP